MDTDNLLHDMNVEEELPEGNSEAEPPRSSRKDGKKKKKKARGCLITLIIFMVMVIGAAFLVRASINYVKCFNDAVNPDDVSTIDFTVKKGATTTYIAGLLEYKGLIDDEKVFIYKSKFMGYDGKYQAGNFKLSPSMTMEEIMTTLQDAKRSVVRFTIAEGLNLKQVGEKLQEQGICSAAKFYEALEDSYSYDFIGSANYEEPTGVISAQGNRLEGFLFPDTYEVYADATAHDVVNKMLARYDEVYDSSLRQKAAALGLTNQQVAIIASLIERECRVDTERPLVASVIFNRLSIDMKLQFCSTVQYAQGEVKSRLTLEDTKIESPYNTYIIDGLPPAPIASFGKASLEAAVSPATTDYLYFVVKNDGTNTHNFAANYNDFANYKEDYLNTLD